MGNLNHVDFSVMGCIVGKFTALRLEEAIEVFKRNYALITMKVLVERWCLSAPWFRVYIRLKQPQPWHIQ
jgi:hypothetical protein